MGPERLDAEPRALKPVLLMTTLTVVLGCVAAYLTLQAIHWNSGAGQTPFDPAEVRAIPDSPGTSESDSAQIAGLVDLAIVSRLNVGSTESASATVAEDRLASRGIPAVPRILTAIATLSKAPSTTPTALQVGVADRVLRRIRAALPSPGPEIPPMPISSPWPTWARAWFAWWEAVKPS
jgi:hypothetical protein